MKERKRDNRCETFNFETEEKLDPIVIQQSFDINQKFQKQQQQILSFFSLLLCFSFILAFFCIYLVYNNRIE